MDGMDGIDPTRPLINTLPHYHPPHQAFVLKDRLDKHMWLGVGINLVAMCLVSATTFFDRENKTGTCVGLSRLDRMGYVEGDGLSGC